MDSLFSFAIFSVSKEVVKHLIWSFSANSFTNTVSKSLSVFLKLKLQCAKEILKFNTDKRCVKTTESIPPEMAINSFFSFKKGKFCCRRLDSF